MSRGCRSSTVRRARRGFEIAGALLTIAGCTSGGATEAPVQNAVKRRPPGDAGTLSDGGGTPTPGRTRERLLYVANDATSTLDVFDIDDGHRRLRSIEIPGTRFRGVTAHAASARLYYTESSTDTVGAVDLLTDRIVWARSYQGPHACKHPDRLNVTLDGKTLYVPCADDDRLLFVDAETGQVDEVRSIPKMPHNTFTGESGKYMYVSTHEGGPLYLFDPRTHDIAKEIGPFSSSVRPFTVDETEAHAYANLTDLLGFAAIDLASGGIQELAQETPAERRSHPEASAGRPHAGAPFSHGIALRPGSRELWFLDDEWGYLYVYDTSTSPPSHQTDVPLFTDLTRPWTQGAYRWVAFDLDGKYCYPSDGSVVDAETKALVPGAHISPSEKLVAIDFESGKPVRVSGQNGGVYPPRSP
jgi:DNA-binding beta-propeller fold protein YncE